MYVVYFDQRTGAPEPWGLCLAVGWLVGKHYGFFTTLTEVDVKITFGFKNRLLNDRLFACNHSIKMLNELHLNAFKT